MGDGDGVDRRALSFGSAAADYERFRPGYPEAVADLVLAYARPPVREALEIGAGTGKATRLFASRGVAVTATEPDAAMLEELRRRVPQEVETIQAAFEDLRMDRRVDLLFAAASLHWTDPATRWERAASLLRSRGTFASFGGPQWLADPELEAAILHVRSTILGTDDVPQAYSTAPDAPMQWPGTELEASPAFTDVEQHVVPRRTTLDAGEWIGHLGTVSAYRTLPEADRAEVLRRIAGVLPDRVDVVGDVVIHLARRV